MKTKFKAAGCIIALLLIQTTIQAQVKSGFTITGSIKGIKTGMVKLGKDSVPLKNGTFKLKGKVDQPEMLKLQITPGNWNTELFVENSNMTVKMDTAGAKHYGSETQLKRVTVSGSAAQDQYNQFKNNPEQLKYERNIEVLQKSYKIKKSTELREKITEAIKANRDWKLKWIKDFADQHPDAPAGPYLFNDFYQFDAEMTLAEQEMILSKFTGNAKKSKYYFQLTNDVDKKKKVLPGNSAPDFTLLKRDSTNLSLSSLRGKYVMIDFWASWCVPCRKAIPFWKKTYEKYHGKGFEIMSVSADMQWSAWIKALDVEKMPWLQVCDEFPSGFGPSKAGDLYQVRYLPFYVLLDKEGKILVYSGNEEEIVKKLEEVL